MKIYLYLVLLFVSVFCAQLSLAQNDPSVPTTSSGGGGGVKSTKKESLQKMMVEHQVLVMYLSDKWKECGGDNSQMNDLQIIAANLLVVYEAHKKGPQPECEECQKKANRFECTAKYGGLNPLKEFVSSPYIINFLHQQNMSKREAKNLVDTFQYILMEEKVKK